MTTNESYPLLYDLIRFGGYFNLIIAFALIIRTDKNFSHYIQSAFYVCAAVFLFSNANISDSLEYYNDTFIMWEIPAMATVGPLMYAYIVFVIQSRLTSHFPRHFIIPVVCLAGSFLFLLEPAEVRLSVATAFFKTGDYLLIHAFFAAGFLSGMSYSFFSLYKIAREPNIKSSPFILIIFIATLIAVCFVMTGISVLLQEFLWIRLSVGLIAVSSVGIFLFGYRYPDLLDVKPIAGEEKNKTGRDYVRKAIPFDEIAGKLQKLMVEEKVYEDDELTVSKLAKRLAIPRHHLSLYLNEKENKHFRVYINEFRIKRAIEIVAGTDKPITAIAYEVGFNSLSLFNRYFREATGVSPSHYRKNLTAG